MSASVIRYRKLVTTDVASQEVNLAESGTMGHRVQIPISVDDLNTLFVWDRPVGSERPVGHFNADSPDISFDTILSNSLSKVYTDIDGMTNGLNFSSSTLDANTDSRVRKGGEVLANDIVMCYVIYKCYGSSSAPTQGVVYNLQDAQDMLSNGSLVSAIHTSLANEEILSSNPGVDKGSIDAMFRDLLAADPSRFFDAAGKQIPGLFETVADKDARGSWCFVENDKIEIAVQMRFVNSVTRQAVGEGEDTTQNIVITAGTTFKIRLQLVATDTPSGAAIKQEIAQANTSAEIIAQADATAKAATNAAAAQRAATQAVSAAATQSATVQARYQKAVDDSLKQATAVLKAQAALQAANAALNQAIISGKSDSDIQNQRAAAVAAQALVENIQAIAEIAASDLQNAKIARDSSTANLAAAQLAASTAAANVASANAAAAIAAKKKADDAASAAAIEKAAADAASDPLTKDITDAESVVLDPQTLVKLDAEKNSKTLQRRSAEEAESAAEAKKLLATQKYDIIRYAIDYAISLGKNDSEIQILRAGISKALDHKMDADLEESQKQSTLIGSYNIESRAISASIQAKKQAAILSASSAAANTNDLLRKLAVATTAFTYASTIKADALEAANEAQAVLDSRISGGATFNEVQTRRKAVLDANTFLASRKASLDSANATMIDCQSAVNTAQAVKVAADTNVSNVNTESAYMIELHQSSITAKTTYQAQKLADAASNQLDLDVTNALIQLNIAKDKSSSANAVYEIAKRNLDSALSGGKRLAEITVLQEITQSAQLEQQRSDVILQKAQVNYNKYVSRDNTAAAAAILNSAAEFQSTQIGRAQMNTQAILYNSTLAFYLDASANVTKARKFDDIMLENLNAMITGGSPLAEITILRNKKVDSSNMYAKSIADFNTASAAMSTVSVGVTENPNVSTILYTAQVLRESEINSANSSDLMRMSNRVFTEFVAISVKAEYNYQNSEALKDMLATALANGKSLSEITQLQESLRNSNIQYANDMMKYEQLSNEYDNVSALMNSDPSLVETLVNSYNVLNYGTVYERASKNIKDLTAAQITKNNAQTELASIQAEYDVISEVLATAIRQGQTTDQTVEIRERVNEKSRELANKMAILSAATKSLSTSQGNWNTVKNSLFTSDSVSSIIQIQDNTYNTIASTLTTNVSSLALSISSAKSNMLTQNIRQTYIDMIHMSTILTEDNNLYEIVNNSFNVAIAQGQTLSQIQDIRLKLQEYSAKRVADSSELINKTAAYYSSLQIAVQSQDAKGILDVVAKTQTIVSEGAKSNELLRNLISAKNLAYDLSIQDTAAQSEFNLAQSALDISTANGEIVKEKYDAILTTSNKVATIRNKLIAALAAVELANTYVSMDPNVQTLQDLSIALYSQQNTKAEANILSEQYFIAKAAETKAYEELDVAKKTYDTVSAAFDVAISSGTDLTSIQNARSDLNLAASKLNAANSTHTYAKAALNTALANANLSQTALALITTARITDENVVAGANVTTAQYALDLLKEELVKQTTVSDASVAFNLREQQVLDSAVLNGMTEQEISNLRLNKEIASEKASADMEMMRDLQKKVLDQQDSVNKYTVVYNGTQAAVTQNNLINYLLFNGFSFQQSIDRYVLNKDVVPRTVTEGINIVLYSQTIIPIDMGIYSNTASYIIGNLVNYPDDSSPQYMCLVGNDPRGSSFSSISGKNPDANPIAWIKTQGAQYRYRSTTDLMITGVTATSAYTVTIPLLGDLFGLQTLFLNSDASGNNTLLNGLTIFGNSVPTSTPTNIGVITNASYVDSQRTAMTFTFSQPITFTDSNSVLYIKAAKSIVDAAVLNYNTYMTNLLAAGFIPVTTLGSLTKSFMNTALLPTSITAGTPFSLGTSTITPTSTGLYSSTKSYTTGDLVTNSNETVFMCLVGKDSRGSSYETTIGNAPVIRPATSIYWYIVDNREWDSFTYNSTTDLQLTLTGFGSILWTSASYPPNVNVQILNPSFLSGYTVFGTGITQETKITSFDHSYSIDGVYSYRFSLNAPTNTNNTDTFYVKNAKVAFEFGAVSNICNNLSANIASAMLHAKSIITMSNTSAAATAIANITTIKTSMADLKTFYATNSTITPFINTTLTIVDECVKCGTAAAAVLSYYLISVEGGVTSEIADLQGSKTAVSNHLNTITTNINTASTHITAQNNTNAVALIPSIQSTRASAEASANEFSYYYTLPVDPGYVLFANKNSTGGNYGTPMGTSVRAYIETASQSNAWNIGTSDYTLEFVHIAGENVNSSGDFVDNFAQPEAGTILMGLNQASATGSTQFALANWGAWRGLLCFNGNNNTWGPLFSNSNARVSGATYMSNATEYYNFGKYAQNHYCEVRKNNVQTAYLNGNKVLEYSTIYASPSNAVLLSETVGPRPAYWQIADSQAISGQAGISWTGGIRNVRLSKEAVYTSPFNTSSTIRGSSSVYYKNLECLSTTILLLPMNNSKMLKDYSLSRLRVSTMAYSPNINSNIKYLSSFSTSLTFASMNIEPVCYLPLLSNTSNLVVGSAAPTITGTVNTFSTMKGRTGVVFNSTWANSIITTFNDTDALTVSYWCYTTFKGSGLSIYGTGKTGSLTFFYDTYGSPEGSGTGTGWVNVEGFMNLGYGPNTGVGNVSVQGNTWINITAVIKNVGSTVTMDGYINGVLSATGTTPYVTGYKNMNAVALGRNIRADGQQIAHYVGGIKDVTIFNKALTKENVFALYSEKLYSNRI